MRGRDALAREEQERRAATVIEFNLSPYARHLGMIVLSTWPGGARVLMECPTLHNPLYGTVHGGAIFSLADHAFGLAANCDDPGQMALSASITYIAPGRGPLVAVAEQVGDDGTHSFYRVVVKEEGRLVAVFEGTSIRKPVPPIKEGRPGGDPTHSQSVV
ncbi:MAG: hotdog fold thioesterase [Methanomicrobiales archaeon]|nr:hotdog fold thioesterase [Methanomicrobiales archaeon]